uniref:Protein cereblon n=1 Tax=Guillardia theta TaxID=55529 RepID=A0A7S4UPL4_GUITH
MVLIDFDAEESGEHDTGDDESSFPSDDEEHSMNEDGDVNEELSRRRTQMLESMNYDPNLPAAHTYLGERSTASGEVIGICKDGDVLDVPVVRASRIIMFPGQSVPMMESNPRLVNLLLRILSDPNERKLVFVNEAIAQKVWNLEDPAGSIGTTAEIRSYCHTPEALNIVLEGRQRVRVQKVVVVEHVLRAVVEVLPESSPPSVPRSLALVNTRARSCRRDRCQPSFLFWPMWAFNMYDAVELCDRAKKLFSAITGNIPVACPQHPVAFSFWLSSNLVLKVLDHQKLLEAHSTVARLRMLINFLERMGAMTCIRCRINICDYKQSFCMSAEGPVSVYVNPAGVVHSTVTFYAARNLRLIGERSTQHSWFPGYAWRIAVCANCGTHMGWRFSCVKEDSIPRSFWGLCRDSLRSSMDATA